MFQARTFTAKEVTQVTGVPHNTLNTWHARGVLPKFFGAGGAAITPGVSRRYSLRESFELTVLSYCIHWAAFEPRVAFSLARTAGDYVPKLDGDNGGPLSLVIVGHAEDVEDSRPDLFIERTYRMLDREFTPDFMPTMRERHGWAGIYILPLSLLQRNFVEAVNRVIG